MDVEVDLYSGRPNPVFRLDVAAAAEFRRRVAALPPALSSRGSVPGGLGYRGLLVSLSGADAPGEDAGRGVAPTAVSPMVSAVVRFGTVVASDTAGSQRRLVDPERGLERWLVEQGAPALEPGTADFLRRAVSELGQ